MNASLQKCQLALENARWVLYPEHVFAHSMDQPSETRDCLQLQAHYCNSRSTRTLLAEKSHSAGDANGKNHHPPSPLDNYAHQSSEHPPLLQSPSNGSARAVQN